MLDWLEAVDEKLSILREREALLRYDADVSGKLDTNALDDIAKERSAILLSNDLHLKVFRMRGETEDPEVFRQCELLDQQILLAKIDEAPDLFKLRNELEQEFYDFRPRIEGKEVPYSERAGILTTSSDKDLRRTAHECLKPYLEATEAKSRKIIKLANAAARSAGFPTYVDAKLNCQDLDRQTFLKTFHRVGECWRPTWNTFLERGREFVLNDIQESDLYFLLWKQSSGIDQDGMPTAIHKTVADTLSLFGLDLEQLPIQIEYRSIPHSGAVHTLKVGNDIRIVMREEGVQRVKSVLFHELGHALYYAYAPTDSVLLLDGRIGREALAELWACLIETPEWLERFSTFSPSDTAAFLIAQNERAVCNGLTCLRESLFELALYQDPDADFLSVWRTVTKECLGFDDRTTIYSEFVFLYPMDIKDYVYTRWIAETLSSNLRKRFGPGLYSPETMNYIVQNYYGDWNLSPWHKRLC